MAKRTNKVEDATIWMDKKIAEGMEFPEAHTQACCRFKLNEKQARQLTENYDSVE